MLLEGLSEMAAAGKTYPGSNLVDRQCRPFQQLAGAMHDCWRDRRPVDVKL